MTAIPLVLSVASLAATVRLWTVCRQVRGRWWA